MNELILDNGATRVAVWPDRGAKIASLSHRGREWLWRNPVLDPETVTYDGSFVEAYDTGGYDECFPAVSAGPFPAWPWTGTRIPDHGELWGLPWDAEQQGSEIRTVVNGVRFPYRFERTVRLGDRLSIDYRVLNPTPFEFPFIWSAHPILILEPGAEILLPEGHDLRVFGSSDPAWSLGDSLHWPMLGKRDLASLPGPEEGLAVKLFGRSPSSGRLGLRKGASTLWMRFDPERISHVGLWINLGGWSGVPGARPYYNLGLEPCIGAGDDLRLAIERFNQVGRLPPRGDCHWSLELWVEEA